MNKNLDSIAKDLYGKIETRFPNIKIGDENAGVLSKKTDIPKARFFEFEYEESGEKLGTIAITLDEDDGIIVQISGKLADSKHYGAFRFIRSFRQFAKNRLLKFHVQNIGKDHLDKRDYNFQAKPKEEPVMQSQQPVMESKMYGNARMSYQDLGEARLVIKHSQPVNPEVAAGRTMHIDSIYVENADGERFKYPFKHLNGARAMAEHLKHGGNPYDSIGQHISNLSEELTQLRKFKGYVTRNGNLAEAMNDITPRVMERIEAVKKEVAMLQRPSYYEAFAESFEDAEDQMIPEEIMNDWIDRLTIRTFNEDLKTAFPYIFRLVDESEIPVKELSPDDLLDENHHDDDDESAKIEHLMRKYHWSRQEALEHLHYNEHDPKDYEDMEESAKWRDPKYKGKLFTQKKGDSDDYDHIDYGYGMKERPKKDPGQKRSTFDRDTVWTDPLDTRNNLPKHHNDPENWGYGSISSKGSSKGKLTADRRNRMKNDIRGSLGQHHVPNLPEDQFESFIDSLMNEDEETAIGNNNLFSPDVAKRTQAIEQLKQLMAGGLKPGVDGINAVASLKGIIDSEQFTEKFLKGLSDNDDAGTAIKLYLKDVADGEIQEPFAPRAKDIAQELIASKALDVSPEVPVGGEEVPPDMGAGAPPEGEVPPGPEAGAMPPEGEIPPGPEAGAPPAEAPTAPETGAMPPAPPVAESMAKLKAKLIRVFEAGADLNTKLDFGHRVMTLGEAMEECGCDMPTKPQARHDAPIEEMMKSITGFFNPQEKNFTIGGMRAKIKILKDFKNGAFKGATPHHVKQVITMIDKLDPSQPVDHGHQMGHHQEPGNPQDVHVSVGKESVAETTSYDDLKRIVSLVHYR